MGTQHISPLLVMLVALAVLFLFVTACQAEQEWGVVTDRENHTWVFSRRKLARVVDPQCAPANEYLLAHRSQSPTCTEGGSATVATSVPRGQLGNHLHTYALLSALSLTSKNNKITFLLASSTWRRITKTFKSDHLLLGSIDQLCLCRNQSGLAAKVWRWSRWEEPFVESTFSSNLKPNDLTALADQRCWIKRG